MCPFLSLKWVKNFFFCFEEDHKKNIDEKINDDEVSEEVIVFVTFLKLRKVKYDETLGKFFYFEIKIQTIEMVHIVIL